MSLKRRKDSKRKLEKYKNKDESTYTEDDNDTEAHDFVKSLNKLQETDPEFYEFLQENDKKLLEFNVDSDGSEDNYDSDKDEETIHKPSDEFHGDSDESDFEEEGKVSTDKLTLKTINEWQKALQSEGKIEIITLSQVINAFHGALVRVSGAENEENSEFKVEGTGVFNSVIQMCVLYLQPAVKKVLGMKEGDKHPQKCKRWVKVKGLLKTYFIDLFKLLGGITSINILTVLLKHLHQMSVFLSCFPSLTKVLFKRLMLLWSTSEETVRVLAFLCILRVTRNNQQLLLESTLKTMYITYVKYSKFVSPNTKPGISFMKKSLIEMFALDVNASYQHVFLYIRQLAIHLRNAIILHKKENIQAVYNWQYINSLQLWAELLSATKSKPQLQSLVYPLTMIITNTIKLIPTPQYYPLRFHCIQILINLSRDSEIFIPILPLILEVLTSYDFSKKHKKVSMKPLNFSFILRLSKSHLSENGFKDAVIENGYSNLLETLSLYSHKITFPDITVLCIIQLKNFLKKCSVANYCRKIRLIVDKIEENVKFVESERKKVNFQLSDFQAIKAWETNLKNSGTPLQIYYDNWKRLSMQHDKKKATQNHDLADKLPSLNKKKVLKAKDKASKDGPVELFPSDSEEEEVNFEEDESPPPAKKRKANKEAMRNDKEDNARVLNKKTKTSKKDIKKKKTKRPMEEEEYNETGSGDADEIKDINLSDW